MYVLASLALIFDLLQSSSYSNTCMPYNTYAERVIAHCNYSSCPYSISSRTFLMFLIFPYGRRNMSRISPPVFYDSILFNLAC